eukprot:TRINITY_DN10410_c0_g3_i3.p4 TRINITY_DN10410_c0_g3~~TRINITY_DN10410_c0_g3_i3.p4  ORF type:complete len:103 (-),score=0.63 TRINITY_DN10410_c0_g3_i3:271-579(-)
MATPRGETEWSVIIERGVGVREGEKAVHNMEMTVTACLEKSTMDGGGKGRGGVEGEVWEREKSIKNWEMTESGGQNESFMESRGGSRGVERRRGRKGWRKMR